jgi:hypothetical protein
MDASVAVLDGDRRGLFAYPDRRKHGMVCRATDKRMHGMRRQAVAGMRIRLIARYRFWRQSLLNKDSRDFLYLTLNAVMCAQSGGDQEIVALRFEAGMNGHKGKGMTDSEDRRDENDSYCEVQNLASIPI